MNQALSYVAFGTLVMGGVPLQDWPEPGVSEKRKKPHTRNLKDWLMSFVPLFETQHHPAAAH